MQEVLIATEKFERERMEAAEREQREARHQHSCLFCFVARSRTSWMCASLSLSLNSLAHGITFVRSQSGMLLWKLKKHHLWKLKTFCDDLKYCNSGRFGFLLFLSTDGCAPF